MAGDFQSAASYLLVLLIGVGGWLATHLVGKPFLTYRALRAEIARCLILYTNISPLDDLLAPGQQRIKEAQTKYRDLAGELVVCINTIAFYRMWSLIRVLPTREKLEVAKGNLIGLSNSVGEIGEEVEISKRVNNIRRILRIK